MQRSLRRASAAATAVVVTAAVVTGVVTSRSADSTTTAGPTAAPTLDRSASGRPYASPRAGTKASKPRRHDHGGRRGHQGRPVPAPTQAPSPSPIDPSPTDRVPSSGATVLIGMSSPAGQWSTRLDQTGGVDSRRVFSTLANTAGAVRTARSEVAAGRLPVLSFKVPGNDWSGVASGRYDAALRTLAAQLSAVGGEVFVTLHHEPTGDGSPSAYAAMMRHALPILGAPANVDAGPIVNGFWWSDGAQGLSDAQIAQWLPPDVLSVSEVVAADTYQGGDAAHPGEDAGVKIRNLSRWADRVGVERLGIGEYNGVDARSIKAAGDAILADPRFAFADIFNSSNNNRAGIDWTLTGSRLDAFRATVAQARAVDEA